MKKELLKKIFSLVILELFIILTFVPTIDGFDILDDTTPPVTAISFDPTQPNGCNGWYVSNIIVFLNSSDDLSGVNITFYRVNGSEWNKYSFPFEISEEGENILIEFYSIDNAGNVEITKSAILKIDKTPPKGTIEWKIHKIGCCKWEITFYINITEDANGIDKIEFYINDVLQITIAGPGPSYCWSFIFTHIPKMEIKIIVWDEACNNATFIINGSDIHSHPMLNSISHWANPLLNFFDRFIFLQYFLENFRRGN